MIPETRTTTVVEAVTPAPETPLMAPTAPVHEEARGPVPVGTLMVVAVLLLVTIAFWCLVLGIQQGRA
ncbi:hypothetical protein [Deinococcus sp.]|uniref:hypothetical protein n=1 Tax=Deinococcus sp. TaxID=47478 RepID=UPI0025C50AFD|nr:hypothetical protein [Deinococcus sp.]